ncbi:MAG: hypothetical protein RMY34_33250 [Aulosira sp. DedQUE10]|nr:hypothetical protein [Aulosira sp. DedQUE10]
MLSTEVGWVEAMRYPTNSEERWVSFLKRHFTQVGKPAHVSGSPTYVDQGFWL